MSIAAVRNVTQHRIAAPSLECCMRSPNCPEATQNHKKSHRKTYKRKRTTSPTRHMETHLQLVMFKPTPKHQLHQVLPNPKTRQSTKASSLSCINLNQQCKHIDAARHGMRARTSRGRPHGVSLSPPRAQNDPHATSDYDTKIAAPLLRHRPTVNGATHQEYVFHLSRGGGGGIILPALCGSEGDFPGAFFHRFAPLCLCFVLLRTPLIFHVGHVELEDVSPAI